MKKLLLLFLSVSAFSLASKAQDTVKTTSDAPLVIFGSADAYYKYDFSGHNNIPTYYGTDQNSFSVGMIDFGFKKKVGKAAVVAELSFGPRSDASLPVPSNHIENLYVSYDVTDAFNITGGYMQTFVGYEVISPTGNFNYSTSYLFSAGPFQNAGVKATYTFSPAVSLMAGVFNDQWNVYSTTVGSGSSTTIGKINTFGAQLMVVPVKNWTAYVNLLTGPASGTIIDLTTNYQITEAFKLGLNAANKTGNGAANYKGAALYPQLAVSKSVSFGLREEYFKFNDISSGGTTSPGFSALGSTLTANIKSGPLTFMPEVRLDHAKDLNATVFTDKNGMPTKSASQFVLAAVYAF